MSWTRLFSTTMSPPFLPVWTKMPTWPFVLPEFAHTRPTWWMWFPTICECLPPSYRSIPDELPRGLPTLPTS
jgi:hypothetical protein